MRSWTIDYYNFDSELKRGRYLALDKVLKLISPEVARIVTNMIVESIIKNNIRRTIQGQIFHSFGMEDMTDD